MMSYNDYLKKVSNNFSKADQINIDSLVVKKFYDEEFKLSWLVTKLKLFSFVSYKDKIDRNDISSYSKECINHAINNYKGLPRGFQNGVVAFNVLVSENVSQDAIDFAMKIPKKHFAAFEIPIIFDLSQEKIFFFKKTPIWGMIYFKYFKQYIEKNLNI